MNYILFMIVVLACTATAQQVTTADTTARTTVVVPPLPFQRLDLSLPPLVSYCSTGYWHASLTAPLSLTDKANLELQSIWMQELEKQNEGKTWRAILGTIQMGGTAYLLYEHIHKYGLK